MRAAYRLPGLAWLYHFGMALAGAVICGFPSRGLTVIGITGTKGKTTVAELLTVTLEAAGRKTALLSSVHSRIGDRDVPNRTGNSMPGRFFIQRFLRDAKKAGCTHAVIEVTSQGVIQARHRFINWRHAAITNIAPEHIESHGSFERYRGAKLVFLKYAVGQGATAYVNSDDGRSAYFRENLPGPQLVLYSKRSIEDWPEGLLGSLPGEFNKENVAAALAVARKLGISDDTVKEALRDFQGVPGRMEFVAREPFRVVVDYAHTPDSMEAVYKALRSDMKAGAKLIAVFGSCGGGRDKWKRPVMGEVAARYADQIILTNEDPYDEDPGAILDDIQKGIPKAAQKVVDRREAIRAAMAAAKPGDTVIVTGKGSERSIHIEDGKAIDWSDREEAKNALENIGKIGI